MSLLLLSSLLLFRTNCTAQTGTAAAPQPATPILIELFTSEGCSSCPPADAWLKKIDVSQPIPGALAIVLSEHVDYWNHDGWKDPYSSSFFTDRQSAYVHALGGSSPYTPEMIVDGATELHLEDQRQVAQAFQTAAKAPQLSVSISALTVEGDSPSTLRAHIDADGSTARHSADVYAVIALDHAESQVLRGENGGRRLSHAAVALDLVHIGRLEKGRTFSEDFKTKLKPGVDPKNLRLVVFVQEPGPGSIVGAALREVSSSSKSAHAARLNSGR
ncbi:MAG: DUF1223 domain-containing protein [Terracidiphilus sp.]